MLRGSVQHILFCISASRFEPEKQMTFNITSLLSAIPLEAHVTVNAKWICTAHLVLY